MKSLSAKNVQEAVSYSGKIGYPVVMKIDSSKASHKSDVGGVMLDLRTPDDVKNAFNKIRVNAKKAGIAKSNYEVLIQEFRSGGVETILGVQQNPSFGPLLMFGLGGIHVEVLKDVSFGITPISSVDAKEMVQSIKGYQLLKGSRGQDAVNEDIIQDAIQRLSRLVTDFEDIAELDINPFLAQPKLRQTMALDARIVLTEK